MPSPDTFPDSVSRRTFLGTAATASFSLASLGPLEMETDRAPNVLSPGDPNTLLSLKDNIYTRLLGVRPHLGSHEHISRLGGGRMPAEVIQAMAEANDYFVDMHELNIAAGKRAAELLGAPAALITSGGFSAMILGAAACLTGSDEKKIEALPQPDWPKRECLIQTAQKFGYDRAYRAAGASVVYADTRDDLRAKMGETTAMIAGLAIAERQGVFAPPFNARRAPPPNPNLVKPEDLIALGKSAGVPVIIDMASDLPPWDNLQRFLGAGADLVVVSGGKCIGGPQATGMLLGRADLVEAARLNAYPFENIGRGMKVGKEEIVGLIVALERFVKQDHLSETAGWAARANKIAGGLQGIPGVTATTAMNTAGYTDAEVSWDEKVVPLNRDAFRQQLSAGTPKLELEFISLQPGTSVWRATARTRQLRDGEEVLVAQRLRAIFEGAGKRG